MIKSHPTLAVQKPYRLLSLSVVSIMVSIASQTVVANDSIRPLARQVVQPLLKQANRRTTCLLQP